MRPSPVFLAALLLIATPLFASVDLPREDQRWTRLELDDYVIYSSARDNVTRDIAQRLQLMRDGLAVMTRLNVHPPQRVTVILFPNDRSFAPFRDAGMGKKMSHVSALFGGTRDAAYILIDTDSTAGVDRSVYHELTHCFTRNTSGDLPLWFSEGIAEFYSTFQTNRDKLRVGAPIPEHLMWLQSRGLIPLARLFAVDFNSPDYSEQYRAGDFYAESWLLVHYLMIGNAERSKQLGKFLTLLSANEPASSAVEKAFGVNMQRLENELHHYLSQPTMNVVEYTPAEKHTYVISDPTPVTRDTTLLILGKFLSRSVAAQEARPFFDAALKLNPNNGDIWSAVGELAERNGDSAARELAIEKAITAGTSDANAYIAYGHSQLNRGQIEKSRAMFEKAIALNPSSAYAYAGLGATYFDGGNDDKAIEAYRRSLSLDPRDDIALNLVTLYARSGKRDLAEAAIARYITPRGDADRAAQARDMLLIVDLNHAFELARAGKMDDALALARSVQAAAKSNDMKQRAGDGVRQLEAQIERTKQVEQINHAITLANTGHLKDAIAIIDSVLPSITDAEMQSRTKTLRAQMASAAAKKK
jgi:tetratricopeptide (TPR) repeat protein